MNSRSFKVLLGFVLVVGATAELKIRFHTGAANRKGNDVMKLEEAGFNAPTVMTHECALTPIASPDSPSHRSWNVATATAC